MTNAPPEHRSGFVCIAGRPNVGKSTLLNQILRHKVAITSDRPQTTRNAIRGVLTTPAAQIVFVDTPGLHKPKSALGDRLNRVVRNAFTDVDVIWFLVDVAQGAGGGDDFIADELRAVKTKVVVVLNKIDIARPDRIEEARQRYLDLGEGAPFGISAREGIGVPDIVQATVGLLPEGPMFYPPEVVTDQPERQTVAELIREKVLGVTREEVPHSVAVIVDDVRHSKEKGTEIDATIYVERDSQKGIVIGRAGKQLKEIGIKARRDIESLLGAHVFLRLHVKVEPDWQRRDAMIARFGYGE